MHVAAIIAAGGRGRRLGAALPKQLLSVAGRPILQWSVEAFLASGGVNHVVVAVPPELAADPPRYLRVPKVTVVAGGDRRQDSVANGFDALPEPTEIVLVHDAARPFVDAPTIARVIAGAGQAGAAIAALPASDTVKLSAGATPGDRYIDRTLARDTIFLAQTPQGFRREVLRDAITLGRDGVEATDEAALAERAGHRVQLVDGSRRNIKITTSDDLLLAEVLAASAGDSPAASRLPVESPTPRSSPGSVPVLRVGCGYDLHRLVPGRPLILGGVTIPSDRGLAGHSDADALSHALADAILGAAALGDIGTHFPDTDPRWQGASSTGLLARVVALARARGFVLLNADATVIAERPKLGPHREAIVARLSEVLGLERGAVSVKAKTNEGVDATGRGDAIAVHAVVLMASGPAEAVS